MNSWFQRFFAQLLRGKGERNASSTIIDIPYAPPVAAQDARFDRRETFGTEAVFFHHTSDQPRERWRRRSRRDARQRNYPGWKRQKAANFSANNAN